jgi:hypothetical protein
LSGVGKLRCHLLDFADDEIDNVCASTRHFSLCAGFSAFNILLDPDAKELRQLAAGFRMSPSDLGDPNALWIALARRPR